MTIKDIARLAGCGVSTVSRALNGSSEISDATRARINEVIQKYNYTPNGNARRMRQTAPNSVLLIVNGSSNLFFSPLIEQIQTAAESAGLQLVVNYIDEQEDEVQTAAQLCVEQKPAGIIFLGGDIRNFRRSFAGISVPCVLSTASAKELGFANLSSVSVDDVDGGRMAAEELFRLGHRSIGILGGDLDSGPSACAIPDSPGHARSTERRLRCANSAVIRSPRLTRRLLRCFIAARICLLCSRCPILSLSELSGRSLIWGSGCRRIFQSSASMALISRISLTRELLLFHSRYTRYRAFR